MKYYELTIIPKNFSDSEKIISSLEIKAEKQQTGPDFLALEFYAEPEKIGEIEKKLKSESQIKKYLIVKREVTKTVKTRTPRPLDQISVQEQKVELNEIDKKLKEIFGE